VTIKDSSVPAKDKFVTIEADGQYTVDVSDLTPPFMLRAEGEVGGRQYTLYSAAAEADINGTVNITPLTDLIVANVAQQIAESFYDTGDFSALTPEALNRAEEALQARLQPVLTAVGLEASIDLLRTAFSADHQGLDAALDILRVTVDPTTAQATIQNVVDDIQIIDNLRSQSDATVLAAANINAATLSDTQQILGRFDLFAGFFATALPAADNAGLVGLFSTDFLDGGEDLNAFLSDITSDPTLVGLSLEGMIIESLTATDAQVRFIPNGDVSEIIHWQMSKVNGVWLLRGDQRIAWVFIGPQAVRESDGTLKTLLNLEVGDEGGQGIDYATVTGAGLPSDGVLLVNYVSDGSFALANPPYIGITTQQTITAGSNHGYVLSDDSVIGAIPDDAIYTVELWEDNGTPSDLSDDTQLAVYTAQLTKRPYLNSELSSALFPTITTPSSVIGDAARNGGNLTVTWTLPAGLKAEEISFYRSLETGNFDSIDNNLEATATSTTFVIGAPTGTIYGNGISLFTNDAFGRDVEVQLNGT
jgi:hypothetical protein